MRQGNLPHTWKFSQMLVTFGTGWMQQVMISTLMGDQCPHRQVCSGRCLRTCKVQHPAAMVALELQLIHPTGALLFTFCMKQAWPLSELSCKVHHSVTLHSCDACGRHIHLRCRQPKLVIHCASPTIMLVIDCHDHSHFPWTGALGSLQAGLWRSASR